jgi:hypothetical protein
MPAAPHGGEQPVVVERLATVTRVRRYPFVASRCRFTYSQNRFVVPDGGIGTLPNGDSSVSVHPLKLTAYPPSAPSSAAPSASPTPRLSPSSLLRREW